MVVLVAVALGVAGLLLQGPGDGIFGGDDDNPPAETPPAEQATATITRSIDFDPQGDDGAEHPEEAEAGNAFDGDPTTSWSSESYRSPELAGLKPGVGLILELDEAGPISAVEFDTPLIRVASRGLRRRLATQDSLDGWGEPVGTFSTSDSGTATVDVDAEGGAVLLWFTRANDGGSDSYVQVDEVRILR